MTIYGATNCTGSPKALIGTSTPCTASDTCLDPNGKGTISSKLAVCYDNEKSMVTALGTTEPFIVVGVYSDKSACNTPSYLAYCCIC